MPIVEFKGHKWEVDEDGFLSGGLDVWDRDWVEYVKHIEGIPELTDEHWKCIHFLQDYYRTHGIAPMVRIFSKVTGFKLKKIMSYFHLALVKALVRWQVYQNLQAVCKNI